MNGTRSWDDARRILAVRLDAAGDVLMTTPAIRALLESAPGREVTLLTSPSGAAIAHLVPEVDRVIEYTAPWMKPPTDPDPTPHLEMIEALRREAFDAAVIFTVYSQSALPAATLCTMAGIPLRLALSREKPYGLLTDWVPEPEPEQFVRHEAQRQLDLVAAVGATTTDDRLSLAVPSAARSRVAGILRRAVEVEAGSAEWCVIHPGATASSRRYPPEGFAEAAGILAHEHGWRVVVVGGPGDAHLTSAIARDVGEAAVDLGGALGLDELAALIQSAPVLICNNSLAAHIASAVGTPVVDLYALTNPQHAPWRVPHRVLFRDVPCRYCYSSVCLEGHHACLRLVPPREVAEAAASLVEGDSELELDVLPPLPIRAR